MTQNHVLLRIILRWFRTIANAIENWPIIVKVFQVKILNVFKLMLGRWRSTSVEIELARQGLSLNFFESVSRVCSQIKGFHDFENL